METGDPDEPTIKFIKFLVIGFIAMVVVGTGLWQLNYSRYPIVSTDTEVRKKIEELDREHGTIYLQFTDGSKLGVGFARNYQYEPADIFFFGEIGDSLIKRGNTDSISIKRKDKEFIFVLGKELNKHLDKGDL